MHAPLTLPRRPCPPALISCLACLPACLACQDLNAGYPEAFVRKPEAESTPIDVVIGGAKEAGLSFAHVHVCTFRNNLNKILATPLFPQNGWVVDGCYHGNTLFLGGYARQAHGFRG